MREPGDTKADLVERSMRLLLEAADAVGGDIVSGGGTGTWDVNTVDHGAPGRRYCLMDTEYTPHASDFENALFVQATVISKNDRLGRARRRPQGVRHGPRRPDRARGRRLLVRVRRAHHLRPRRGHHVAVGDRVRVVPAHVDPTVSQHERLHVIDGDEVIEVWDVDLRGW